MEVEINNLSIDVDKVGYNDGLNFGRFLENMEVVGYTLELSKDQFLTLIEIDYNQIRDEIKADDEAMNDTSDFSESGYCSLEDLFAKEAAFSEIVKGYLGRPLLGKLFVKSQETDFIINSIDKVNVLDNIVLKGRAFKKL